MFIMQLNLLLGSIVLLASTAFIIWSLRNKGEGSFFGLTIGSLVFVLALISMLSVSFMGIKAWIHGGSSKEMSMETRKNRMQKLSPDIIQKLRNRREQLINMQKQESSQGQDALQPQGSEKK